MLYYNDIPVLMMQNTKTELESKEEGDEERRLWPSFGMNTSGFRAHVGGARESLSKLSWQQGQSEGQS